MFLAKQTCWLRYVIDCQPDTLMMTPAGKLKKMIDEGLKDIEDGRTNSHKDVMKEIRNKYGI